MTAAGDMPPANADIPATSVEGDIPFEDEDGIGTIPVDTDGITDSVSGGPVLAHVQRFADAVRRATGAQAISTYEGHHPDRTRALDILVTSAYGVCDSTVLGDSVARFTLENWSAHGVMYIIWRQRINSNDGRGWRAMEDRGSNTQNHCDHCHVSFESDWNDSGYLRIGSSGEKVRRLQARLKELGWNLDADGDFGLLTEAAVMEFQGRNGLEQDGVVGPVTSRALGFGWPM